MSSSAKFESNGNDAEQSQRVVRFHDECVLIPEPCRRRRSQMLTTYSVPLWRRRGSNTTSLSDSETQDVDPLLSNNPEDTHVMLKLPVPSFIRRSSKTYSAPDSPPLSPTMCLFPCIPFRSPSRPAKPIATPVRRPSLPTHHQRKPCQTVPLRACCPDCFPITEKCLREGSTWQEKFTRRASLDLSSSGASSISTVGSPLLPIRSNSYDETTQSAHCRYRRNRQTSSPAEPLHKHTPAVEEDESELFPLPTPRRCSPSSTASGANIAPTMKISPKTCARPLPISRQPTSSAYLHPSSAQVPMIDKGTKTKTRSREGRSSSGSISDSGLDSSSSMTSESASSSSEELLLPINSRGTTRKTSAHNEKMKNKNTAASVSTQVPVSRRQSMIRRHIPTLLRC